MSAVAPVREHVIAGEPRVQLLPPSVRQRERMREARRLMALLVVLAVTIVAGGMTWAYFRQSHEQLALEAATARTDQLLAEQAQYAEASQLASLVEATRDAQRTVTANEVLWQPFVAELSRFLPDHAVLSGLTLDAPAPWQPGLAPEGPLREPRIAIATVELSGTDYQMAAAFVAAVPALPGFADVKITSTVFEAGIYRTVVSIALDAGVLADRFGDGAVEGAAGSDEGGDS